MLNTAQDSSIFWLYKAIKNYENGNFKVYADSLSQLKPLFASQNDTLQALINPINYLQTLLTENDADETQIQLPLISSSDHDLFANFSQFDLSLDFSASKTSSSSAPSSSTALKVYNHQTVQTEVETVQTVQTDAQNSDYAVDFNILKKELKDIKKLLLDASPLHSIHTKFIPRRSISGKSLSDKSKSDKEPRKTSNASQIYTLMFKNLPHSQGTQEIVRNNLAQISNMKREMITMRSTFFEFQNEMNTTLLNLSSLFQQVIAKSSNEEGASRKMLLSAKTRIENESAILSERLQDLVNVVEQVKLDTIKHKCRISSERMGILVSETHNFQHDLNVFIEFVDHIRPTWKALWEKELEMIVKEQGYLKSKDHLLMELEDSYYEQVGLLTTLSQLATMQNEDVVPVKINVTNPEMIRENGGLDPVLVELIQVIDQDQVGSIKRMDALVKSNRVREWEKKHVADNDFEVELLNFKLRITGGVQEIERIRKEKTKLYLKSINVQE